MKRFAALLVGAHVLMASPSLADQSKRMVLRMAEAPIEIDGAIDPAWASADSTDDFFQLEPFYNRPPSRRTVAKVISGADALYCLLVCYAAKDSIQSVTGVLDQGGGDVVSLMVDTFNDKQTAYKFAVTAGGVRQDARMLDDARNRDYAWDGVWFATSRVYDWGYVVEIKVPYKSIRFNPHLQSWGLDFDRWIPQSKEDLYWCKYEQNEGQRISKFGTLELNGFRPSQTGLNLEVYPVGIAKARDLTVRRPKVEPDAGIDIFYNPSEALTFQLTGNPDFAQIEADPFAFNISRYETYFDERRPFFTEGNEVFMASGRQRNTGFYRPLELLYTRRIGRLLPGGTEVPLIVGTKAFGRTAGWEYGGFYSLTGETDYLDGQTRRTEPRASFVSGRLKKTILDNSTLGMLFVGKITPTTTRGVIDIDGAVRTSDWQLSYQVARSIDGSNGDFAGSAGFVGFGQHWLHLYRLRAVGNRFDINEVGFVPWRGTVDFVGLTGPVWFFDTGSIRQIILYGGPAIAYKDAELHSDVWGVLGFNMQFRDNWGYEINIQAGESRDQGKLYNGYEFDLSSWYNISPSWSANLFGGYAKTYNFSREYVAKYGWMGIRIDWKALSILELGTTYDMYVEQKPGGALEDITLNARPYFSLTPFNNINLRLYVDNVFSRSSDRNERVVIGILFSYNFLPKSWIYLAFNEVRERAGIPESTRRELTATERAGVGKVKYLYYF
ncbi:MAG: DUF5916 domain-containing protein [Bacteroidota bacterium]